MRTDRKGPTIRAYILDGNVIFFIADSNQLDSVVKLGWID